MAYRWKARSTTPGDYRWTDAAIAAFLAEVVALPNVPTLTIADNEDGTGAVATIADSTAGTTNVVKVATWYGVFTTGGSRTGDGTVALTLAKGPYWAYVESTNGNGTSMSEPLAFRVTTASEAVFYQCLTAVQSVIQSLSLSGVSATDIKVWKTPWVARLNQLPGIVITPVPEKITPATNQKDDVEYGVSVAMARVSNQSQTDGMATVLKWREQISRALRYKPLTGVSEVYTVRVEPGQVFWEPAFQAQHDVGALTIRCVAREPRSVI
jgi:hypothetical protein